MGSKYHPKRTCRRGCGRTVSARHLARHEAWCFFPRTIERLHEIGEVRRVGDCLVWNPARRNIDGGYGRVGPGEQLAHKLAFALAGGVVPRGYVVCHSCDNKGCVEPTHLRAATQGENLVEAYERGLSYTPAHRVAMGAAQQQRWALPGAREKASVRAREQLPRDPCEVCGEPFVRGAPLAQHRRKRHPAA